MTLLDSTKIYSCVQNGVVGSEEEELNLINEDAEISESFVGCLSVKWEERDHL